MNELTIFKKDEFGQIRTIANNSEILFCLKDVCDILEIGNPSDVKKRLDSNGVDSIEVVVNSGLGKQKVNMIFINEDNLYDCILDSRKPNARKIRKWVTSEILPNIRKTGMYLTDNVYDLIIQDPEKFGQLLIEYGKTKKENEQLKLDNKIKQQRILEMEPKENYYDKILQSKELLTITQIAKDYGMTGIEMNQKLKELDIQYKQGKIWLLKEKHQTQGYTKTKTVPFVHSDGTPDSNTYTCWTQKGRLFLYDLLKQNKILPLIEREEVDE